MSNFAQSTGAGLDRCQCELPVFYRLRLTPFRPEPLRRSCNCLRGCFASLTQGPIFSSLYGADQARSAGREESPCVYPSNFPRTLQSKRHISASSKKSFSLLDRARPVFSFSALRKRENGGCIPQHGQSPCVVPRPAAGHSPAPPPWGEIPRPPAGGPPERTTYAG